MNCLNAYFWSDGRFSFNTYFTGTHSACFKTFAAESTRGNVSAKGCGQPCGDEFTFD